jgi:lipoprotein-anchoring transpeptidase ErfK/SrfK
MPDYYAILWRTLKTGDYESPQWRNSVFDRTRRMLVDQMRARRPPLADSEIKLHTDALDAAIKTIQSEFARDGGRGETAYDGRYESSPRPRPVRAGERALDADAADAVAFRFNRLVWAGAAVVVAALAAGIYAFQATRPGDAPPPPSKAETPSKPATPATNKQATAPATVRPVASLAADGDLAPGVDGGSTDADVPFFFRRQPVFYRTTHPVGTLIVDKSQHFLYLIQPNQVALRYGVGIGKPCADVAGLRRVSSKVEWPQWQAPAKLLQRKPATPAMLPGGPGNPLGARLIGLDDGISRIHGTNAPKTIGNFLNTGCIRLVNDDVVDLYNRVAMDGRVVLND